MSEADAGAALTRALLARVLGLDAGAAPPPVRTLVVHCLLDFVAVAIAGAAEPAVEPLRELAAAEGGAEQATVFGHGLRLPLSAAALLNGTSAHALDYDDVNLALLGHPSVPVLPAVLALAEARGSSGACVMDAFLTGYELECRVGRLVAPSHYARGFHATATIGALGAAAACARLLGLDESRAAHALGIAATHSAGLKSLFGTDCKPLHAGNAARSGLVATLLAARGFGSRPDILECSQGFARTLAEDFHPGEALAEPAGGLHLRANLFKYHASCYETHATIECARHLRAAHGEAVARARAVTVRVNPHCARICNIPAPTTGLESKFSLRMTAAMALAGLDTGRPEVFDDATAGMPPLVALRERVTVAFDAGIPASVAEMGIALDDGRSLEARHDASQPATDLAAQGARLERKFRQLVAPRLGDARCETLLGLIGRLPELPSMAPVMALVAPAAAPRPI